MKSLSKNSSPAKSREASISSGAAVGAFRIQRFRAAWAKALFGKYFFTGDETRSESKTVYLIEAENSRRARFPSKNEIRDGLLKMILYTN